MDLRVHQGAFGPDSNATFEHMTERGKCRSRTQDQGSLRGLPRTDGLAGLRVVRILEAASKSLQGRGELVELKDPETSE